MTTTQTTAKTGRGTPRGTADSHQSHHPTPHLTCDFPTVPSSPTSHSHPSPTSPTTLRSGTVGHLGQNTETRHPDDTPGRPTSTHTKSTTHTPSQRPQGTPAASVTTRTVGRGC